MKNFKIISLSLSNFKGQTRIFVPNEDKTNVRGANGVGKTTLYKAFCWLFTSYTDSINVKNHELYDLRNELTPNTPQAVVRAIIEIDGVEYSIERRAKAKFTRKRGSTEWVKDSSDSYTILIDDIETSAGDFNAWLDRNIGNVDLIPFMFMGERFANLVIDDKAKARKILEQITGEITIDMMCGDYSMIAKDLQKYPIEQVIERYKTALKPLNQRLSSIDSLIEAKEQELREYNGRSSKEIEDNIVCKAHELRDVEQCIVDATNADSTLAKKRENILKNIHELSVELGDKRIAYNLAFNEELSALKKQISEIDLANELIVKENDDNRKYYKHLQSSLENEKEILNSLREERELLLKRLDDVKARKFTENTCAYCGQELPQYELDVALKKFNEQKSEDTKIITKRGKNIKQDIELHEKKVLELDEKISTCKEPKDLLRKDDLLKEYEKVKKNHVPFEETKTFKCLNDKINKLKESMPKSSAIKSELIAKRDALILELQELNREFGKTAIIDKIAIDIKEYKDEKRNIGNDIAKIEGCIANAKEYEEERAKIISDKINDKLDDCKIVMYSRQKDGSLKPDCVIINNDGVKYATLNNSARISICLSLQRMFCKHFDINLPIFVDESAVFDSKHLPKFEAQTIYLFASDDINLEVE